MHFASDGEMRVPDTEKRDIEFDWLTSFFRVSVHQPPRLACRHEAAARRLYPSARVEL